jgi:hypothetical protein
MTNRTFFEIHEKEKLKRTELLQAAEEEFSLYTQKIEEFYKVEQNLLAHSQVVWLKLLQKKAKQLKKELLGNK